MGKVSLKFLVNDNGHYPLETLTANAPATPLAGTQLRIKMNILKVLSFENLSTGTGRAAAIPACEAGEIAIATCGVGDGERVVTVAIKTRAYEPCGICRVFHTLGEMMPTNPTLARGATAMPSAGRTKMIDELPSASADG